MNFKGGVIIIGSLLWDSTALRERWRKLYLNDLSNRVPVKIKMRYGRLSRSRKDTYTMIFSNDDGTDFGQAYVIGFRELIKNAKYLRQQAFALAEAEGISKNSVASLNTRWGTVGLLINPNVDLKNKEGAEMIRKKWKEIYSDYKEFDYLKYRITDNDQPVIDENGFLQIDWIKELNEFDFLIATPVVPNIKKSLSSKNIADKMIDAMYFEYFQKNYQNGIRTFQDPEIFPLINDKLNNRD